MAVAGNGSCMAHGTRRSRRRFIQIAGVASLTGLAGCGGGNGAGGDGGGDGDGGGAGDGDANGGDGGDGDGGNGSGGDLGPVPAEYETATSLDGTERSPDSLSAKSDVQYQSSPSDGQQCSGCAYYITDMNDDGLGACAIVEGMIEPEGWCVSYIEYQE